MPKVGLSEFRDLVRGKRFELSAYISQSGDFDAGIAPQGAGVALDAD